MKKEPVRIGIVSYNINCNFTNYGSALLAWALSRAVERESKGKIKPVLVDYCPNAHLESDVLNPTKCMWDKDDATRKNIEMLLPQIHENYLKFEDFYTNQFHRTKKKYDYSNFNDIVSDEHLDGFICGSDTIFCIDEFKGFDDGFYANYPCMKSSTCVSYAASFGDSHFTEADYETLNDRLGNFSAISLRESEMLQYVKDHSKVRVEQVIDPTLLLDAEDYSEITADEVEDEPYLLLYSRRYNKEMEEFAEELAKRKGLKIIEISIRACNSGRHDLRYEAGVEEFLSLVKHAECVVTNSFHGIIFSVQFRRPFHCFSREQGDSKIAELLNLFGLQGRMVRNGQPNVDDDIDYTQVWKRIKEARSRSLEFLGYELDLLSKTDEH